MKLIYKTPLLFFLFIFSLSYSQNTRPVVCKVPPWVEPITPDENCKVNPNDIEDGYFYILSDCQNYIEEGTLYCHMATKIISEAGVQNGSQISINFNPEYEKLCLHKIELVRNGKRINKLDLLKIKSLQRESDLERNIYDGTFTANLILDDVRKGDIIEYSYSLSGRNPIFNEKFSTSFYTQFGVPVGELNQRFILNSNRKINIKEFNNGIKPEVTQSGEKTIYKWHAINIKPLFADDKIPQWFDPYQYTSVSEYGSWTEVKEWAKKLFVVKGSTDKELKDTINAIKERSRSDSEKALNALRFVQNQIRYMGIEIGVYSHQPNTPNKVFKQRFGDCKDKSLLLCTILKELGIESHPVLINTTSENEMLNILPSPLSFNHCTVLIILDGKKYWVDPTISYQAGSLEKNAFPDYGYGLVVTDNSKDLTKIEVGHNGSIRVRETFDITKLEGSCDFTVNTIYEGDEADIIRYQIANSSMLELEENYKNFYAKLYPGIRTIDSIKLVDYPELNKYTITEYYSIDNFWIKDSTVEKGRIKASFEALLLETYISLPQIRIRKMPVGIRHKTKVEEVIEIKLPEEWKINEDHGSYNTSAFQYRYDHSYDKLNRTILLNYFYETTNDFIPVNEVPAYTKAVDNIYNFISFQIYYNENIPDKPAEGGSRNNWPMIAFIIFYSLVLCYIFYKLYFYNAKTDDTLSLNYGRSIGGWLILVMFGMIIRPLSYLGLLISSRFFDSDYLRNISSVNDYWTLIHTYELIIVVTLFLFSIFLLVLFFSYRNSFPRIFIVYLSLSLILSLIDAIMVNTLVDTTQNTTLTTLIGNIVACMIWIPYFLFSHRVKETFIKKYIPKNEN
jgi:transglutaminase-like putative cysteine protease